MISTNYKTKSILKSKNLLKKLFVVMVLLASFNSAKALVTNYTFASTTGNYAVISGTTFVSGAWDDSSSALITIPFTFNYNGSNYTTLSINTNGFITMGAVPATVYCGLQSSALNSIAGYGTDLVGSASSTVQYTTRGSAPNRQFVVQWTDCDHYNNGNANHWTFQIVLNETTNAVQVVWGSSSDAVTMGANTCADAATESGDVGLLGGSTSDFSIRNVTNGSNLWSSSTAAINLAEVCNMSSTNFPATGLTYTWTPGAIVAMSYTSSTTAFVNNGQSVSLGITGNPVIQVQVVVTGTLTPFSLSSLSLSTSGCTNALTDITNAKVYYTGINNIFSTTTQFGSTVVGPNGAYVVNGAATLAEGVNYFWITYDIKNTATIGDILSGCCTQIVGSGTLGTRVPTVTCPAGVQTIASVGIWTPLTNLAPSSSGGLMLLLSDGTVIAKSSAGGGDNIGNVWNKLTPNINGSYINGTWSTIAPMTSTRLYFSSQVLKDGRVYVAGGEYGTGGSLGEVYNPLTNVWTSTPAPGSVVSDANSEILPDGRVLQALVAGSLTGTLIYNPTTNTYGPGPTALGIHNESAWVKLPDNSVLYINRLSTASERYIPATNTWVNDATVPVQLYDAFGDEAGAAVLLPDGRALFLGSSGHNAYYTPSGTSSPGTWAAAPDFPSAKGTPDAPAAMMVNGKVLCAVSPVPTSANHFPSPTTFYEFDYLTNTFTSINAPGGGTSLNHGSYITNMLNLPDGKILFNDQGSNQYYVYTPGGTQLASGKPVIANITATGCTTYRITGTQFNGISQGSGYGDDWQMATNYPVIRLTSGANVYYVRTSNWNSTGVRRGLSPDTATFDLPAGLPAGTYSLVVTANGIASDPFTFTPSSTPTLSSSLTPPAICTNTAFTYTPTSAAAGATFTWTRAAVSGISNAAITTPQSSNPNEVLINTTTTAKSVVYLYTITTSGCGSNTQSVTVIVNPLPAPSIIAAVGNTTFCAGGFVVLNGNTTGGTWSLIGGTTTTLSVVNAGDYFVTTTNTCGTTTSNHIIVTVNPLPTASVITAGGNTTFCSGGNVLLSGNSTGGTWSIGGGTTSTLSATTAGDYFVTTTNTCGSTTSNHINVIVNALPVPSIIAASGNTTFCFGGSVLLNGNTTGGTWSIVGGASSTILATLSGDYFVTTSNACGTTTSNHIVVTVNQLPIVNAANASGCEGSSISLSGTPLGGTFNIANPYTGPTTQFTYTYTDGNGCTNSSSASVTVNPLPIVSFSGLASSYSLSDPSAALIGSPSTGTFSGTGISGSAFSPSTAGVGGPYTITYNYTDGNGCSNSSSQQTAVTNCLPPAQPGTISVTGGTVKVCPGDVRTYKVTAVSGATIYNWTIPTGTSISSGVGTNIISLTFNNGFVASGVLSVTAGNGCGTSLPRTLTINRNTPTTPSVISGTANSCAGSSGVFSVTNVAGMTYNWTAPANTIISNGQGTNSVTISFFSTFKTGIIYVNSSNACSTSANRSLSVYGKPSTPILITGPINNNCNATSTYSIAAVTHATSYTWTTSVIGAVITGSGTSVQIAFPTFTSGTVSVTANNACGASTAKSLSVKGYVATPLVQGNIAVTSCLDQTYTTPAIAGATSYLWTIPSGNTILSGQGTTSILVHFGGASGNITVKGVNACGKSTASTLAITVSGCVRTSSGIHTLTNVNVYPNPSSGKITLEVNSNQEKEFAVTVNDMMGRQIITLNPKISEGINNLDIDMSSFAKGVYTIHLADGQSENNLRVVIQ